MAFKTRDIHYTGKFTVRAVNQINFSTCVPGLKMHMKFGKVYQVFVLFIF